MSGAAAAEDATPTDDAEPDGVLERVVEDVQETAEGAVSFVARLGGALSDGFKDGRQRS